MARKVQGKNGGWLMAREKGDPPSPRAGRPKNLFRQAILEVAEQEEIQVKVWGYLVDGSGNVTDKRVKVQVTLPSVKAVVQKMYRMAAKGDVQAAKWLSETGYGRTVNLGEDQDNPLGGGFAVLLPENGR